MGSGRAPLAGGGGAGAQGNARCQGFVDGGVDGDAVAGTGYAAQGAQGLGVGGALACNEEALHVAAGYARVQTGGLGQRQARVVGGHG